MTQKSKPGGSSLMPGAVVGIVGGGQLGRMMSIAASRLGFHSAILAPDDDAFANLTLKILSDEKIYSMLNNGSTRVLNQRTWLEVANTVAQIWL